jgi:integrase
MAIFKRGRFYWFEFIKDGQRFQKSTKQRNFQAAKDIESAFRTALAKGDVGITEKPKIPTLASFRERFLNEITVKCAAHPATIDFYTRKFDGLLRFKPLANASLGHIDEELISRFAAEMIGHYQRATVNQHLRTLKRALRLAARWKFIAGVPYFELLADEHEREFVLPREEEAKYLVACPEFLRNAAEFMLETGLRRKELIDLRWSDVHFEPAGKAGRGYIQARGTKSRNSKRALSLTTRARTVLLKQQQISECDFVFTRESDPKQPALPASLDHAHKRVRDRLKLSSEFVVHSLRHTFATRLGEAGADAFLIMRLMGHSSITVSQRYVHPTPASMERAFDEFEALASAVGDATSEKETVPTKAPTVPSNGSRMVQ